MQESMPRKPLAVLVLISIALLGTAGPARGLSVPAPTAPALPPLLAAPAGEEEEAWEAEASEEEEAETEECEGDETDECEVEASGQAPPECLLSSADAAIFAAANRDRIRLQIRYASLAPTPVTVAYGLHGSKGALFLGSVKKHFGKRGVLRLNRSLTEAQMAKVMAARDFTVRIRALKAPGWCQPVFDRHLTLRRATPSGISWQQRG
jgi:hypothetical protein